MKCIWPKSKPVCKNDLAHFRENATGPQPVSVSHLQTQLHTVQNQPGSDLALANCQVLAKQTSGSNLSSVQKSSGTLLANTSELIGLDAKWIWHAC